MVVKILKNDYGIQDEKKDNASYKNYKRGALNNGNK